MTNHDLTAIEARHFVELDGCCYTCDQKYPCDTARVLEEVEREDTENTRIIQALDKRCDNAEAALARVRGLVEGLPMEAVYRLRDAASHAPLYLGEDLIVVTDAITALLDARRKP